MCSKSCRCLILNVEQINQLISRPTEQTRHLSIIYLIKRRFFRKLKKIIHKKHIYIYKLGAFLFK
jgi:hypothetical protein